MVNQPYISDAANGASAVNDSATLAYMKSTFTDHYNGNRQPIGLYTHPIHLSVSNSFFFLFCMNDTTDIIVFKTTYPGVNPSKSTIGMINAFLDWAQQQQNGQFVACVTARTD